MFLVVLIGLAGFCLVMWDVCHKLPEGQVLKLRRWFISWILKGLLAPFLLWMAFNSAIWNWLPPLMWNVEIAKVQGRWAEAITNAAAVGLWVAATYWAAFTAAWLLFALWRQTDNPRQFRFNVWIWSSFLFPLAVIITWSFGWRMAGFGATLWFLPILQQMLALRPEQRTQPVYSRAIAAIHFDKYEEAEQAVIEELESCEDDCDGWMMLADLYANQFEDLAGARKVIQDICENQATTPSQFAVACHRLADWELKLAQDPDAARAALENISRRLPRSHLDRMARLRINQLPATREEWAARQSVKKIRLGGLRGEQQSSKPRPAPELSRQEAFNRSQQCVEKLTAQPDDIATREELARLWAENLGQIEMATEQLELLLAMPGVKQIKAAEWLGLIASWHLTFPQNPEAARAVMARLVRQYPQSPQALAAQRRLNVMNIEARLRLAASARHEHRA